MDLVQLRGKYERLRHELVGAYSEPVWHTGLIDRITEEMAQAERAIAQHSRSAPLDDAPRPEQLHS
jgi:hypothetical protein